jgi:hypothetical protein
MANICLYKILVKGTQRACYALIDMMPLYSGEKEIVRESGTEEDYVLLFLGDCKWSVDSYTSNNLKLEPYTKEQLDAVCDGDGWEIPLKGKSLVLNCEIFCNSKDIDDSCYAHYVHYDKGKEIFDECPKELHIKRGRDYDREGMIWGENGWETLAEFYARIDAEKMAELYAPNAYAKVKFTDGRSYWYVNDVSGNVGDLVYVDGAKTGVLGKIIEVSQDAAGIQMVTTIVGHVGPFDANVFEEIWSSYKTKDRREYLKSIEIDETVTKNKFINIIENRWNEFAQKNNDWDEFMKDYKK